MNYDSTEFIKLLKRESELLSQKKYLSDIDRSASTKISHYRALLQDQLYFNARSDYSIVMNQFLNREITPISLKTTIERIDQEVLVKYTSLQKDYFKLSTTVVDPIQSKNYINEILTPLANCLKQQYYDWEEEEEKDYPLIFPYEESLRDHISFIKIRMDNYPYLS